MAHSTEVADFLKDQAYESLRATHTPATFTDPGAWEVELINSTIEVEIGSDEEIPITTSGTVYKYDAYWPFEFQAVRGFARDGIVTIVYEVKFAEV